MSPERRRWRTRSIPPGRWRWLYALLNPVVGPIDGFRHLATGSAPDLALIGWSALGAVFLLAAGSLVFVRLEPDVADVV